MVAAIQAHEIISAVCERAAVYQFYYGSIQSSWGVTFNIFSGYEWMRLKLRISLLRVQYLFMIRLSASQNTPVVCNILD